MLFLLDAATTLLGLSLGLQEANTLIAHNLTLFFGIRQLTIIYFYGALKLSKKLGCHSIINSCVIGLTVLYAGVVTWNLTNCLMFGYL